MSNEQRLIDIMFAIAQQSYLMNRGPKKKSKYYGKVQDDHMAWVAKQLLDNGFETVPMGMSWGVLKNG